MKRTRVASSSLRSVGYDEVNRTLEVEFETGGVYQYFEVPPDVHRNLLAAESLGRYFVEQVRDSYRYARMSG